MDEVIVATSLIGNDEISLIVRTNELSTIRIDVV